MKSRDAKTAPRCSGSIAIMCTRARSSPRSTSASANGGRRARPHLRHRQPLCAHPRARSPIANPAITAWYHLETNTSANPVNLFGLRDPRQGSLTSSAGSRADSARAADRLRRQPHLDSRRLRRLHRHRRIRGGACPDDETPWQKKPKRMRVTVDRQDGRRHRRQGHCRSRDRADPRRRCARPPLEYAGSAIAALSMEGRMTICNMSIEAGGAMRHDRAGRITSTTWKGARSHPKGAAFDRAVEALVGGSSLRGQRRCSIAKSTLDAAGLAPMVTWGTRPGNALPIDGERARSGARDRSGAAANMCARARIYGDGTRQETLQGGDRSHVHRLVHQRAASKICRPRPRCSPGRGSKVPGLVRRARRA